MTRGESTDSTRLLCAAAYLDGKFADSVIDGVLRSNWQAVAPHYGVDIEPVLRHCLASQRRRMYRDLALSLLLGAAILAVWPGGMSFPGVAGRLLLLSWAVVLLLECFDRFQVLPALRRDRFDAADAPPLSRSDERAVAEVARLAEGNVTVYRGFMPFAGSGFQGESWSFVTDIGKGSPGPDGPRTPITFSVESLYAEITSSVRDLRIPALEIEDRVFVSGRDAHAEEWLFTGGSARPGTNVARALIEEVMGAGEQRVRHYLTMRIVDWRGEMVVSMHLRFVISGNHLYTEASYCLVPPLRDSFRAVDDLTPLPDFSSALTVIGRSFVRFIPALVMAPVQAVKAMLSGSAPAAAPRTGGQDPPLDYGANRSARELAMAHKYIHYFQKVDHDMHTKLIEHRMLDALNAFLERHHIDTAGTREQQVNIINSGVMMSGGVINATNMAVGVRAKAMQVVRTATGQGDAK